MRLMNLRTILNEETPEHRALILVTGPFNGGKSTFIHSISERVWALIEFDNATEYYTEGEEVTGGGGHKPVGLGQIRIGEDTALLLLESPGSRRWDIVIDMSSSTEGFAGIVVVFDSAKPETFLEAKSIINTLRAYPRLPYFVAASKQDHPDAWSLEDLKIALRLPDNVPFMPCVATSRDSVRQVLLALLEMMPAERAIAKVRALPSLELTMKTCTGSDLHKVQAAQSTKQDKFEESVAELSSADRLSRRTAAWMLGHLNDKRAVEPLTAALKDKEQVWDTRCRIALALANLGNEGHAILLASLQESDSWVRAAAARALGEKKITKALDPLLIGLQDTDDIFRWATANSLGKLGEVSALNPLINALNDTEPPVRTAAAHSLGILGNVNAVEPLIAALQDVDAAVRWYAINSLGTLRDTRAVRPLITMLQDSVTRVQEEASSALQHIGTREAVEAVRRWREEGGQKWTTGNS